MLSGGTISRDVERFLLWELPLSRGWQYYHAAIVAEGNQTVRSGFSRFDQFQKLMEQF